jgi:hypothetical protein
MLFKMPIILFLVTLNSIISLSAAFGPITGRVETLDLTVRSSGS